MEPEVQLSGEIAQMGPSRKSRFSCLDDVTDYVEHVGAEKIVEHIWIKG